jgi:hypothetical protein
VVSLIGLPLPSTPSQCGGWTRIDPSLVAVHRTCSVGDSSKKKAT